MYDTRQSAFASLATEESSVQQAKLETCREVCLSVLWSTFQRFLGLWSAYQLFIANMHHIICGSEGFFCNYLWSFTSQAESMTSRVRFQCVRSWDHLLVTRPPLASVGKHSECHRHTNANHKTPLTMLSLYKTVLLYCCELSRRVPGVMAAGCERSNLACAWPACCNGCRVWTP